MNPQKRIEKALEEIEKHGFAFLEQPKLLSALRHSIEFMKHYSGTSIQYVHFERIAEILEGQKR